MSTQNKIFSFFVEQLKTIKTTNVFFEDQKYETNIGDAVFEFVDKSSDEKEFEPRTVVSFQESTEERTGRGNNHFEMFDLKVEASRAIDADKKETEGSLIIFLGNARADVLRCLEKNRETLLTADYGACEMFDPEWDLEVDDDGDAVKGIMTLTVPVKYQVNKFIR